MVLPKICGGALDHKITSFYGNFTEKSHKIEEFYRYFGMPDLRFCKVTWTMSKKIKYLVENILFIFQLNFIRTCLYRPE